MAHKTWLLLARTTLTAAQRGTDNAHWDFYQVITIRQDSMSMPASGKCVQGREGGREHGACDVYS